MITQYDDIDPDRVAHRAQSARFSVPIRSIPRPPRGRPISAIRKIRVRKKNNSLILKFVTSLQSRNTRGVRRHLACDVSRRHAFIRMAACFSMPIRSIPRPPRGRPH